MHTEYTHTVSIRCTHSNVPHDWPHLQGRETAPHVEKIREKKVVVIAWWAQSKHLKRFYVVYLGMKSWWEKGCVVQLPSLSHTHTHSFTHKQNPHTLSLNMRIQNYLLNNNNNKKWPLVSYVLVSNKRKRKKHCADWYITDTDQASPICHAHIHTHSQKYSLLDLTPICLIFLLFLSLLFLGKCKSSSFF